MMPEADGSMKPVLFAEMGMMTYNNVRNMYKGYWVDSMETQLFTYTGSPTPDHKRITCYGTMDEPVLKVTGRHICYLTTIIDSDAHSFEMFDLHASDS